MKRSAVCTIVAKNYLPYARVLMESVREWSPGLLRFVILADRVDGYFDPSEEDFTVITSEELGLPQAKWFHFKYTVIELSTAVKPYALEYLLQRYDLEKVIYLDPDICLYASMERLLEMLDCHQVVLTPHLTAPLSDDLRPTELDILRSGTYNLGFIGLARGEIATQLLKWWQAKLYDQCVVDVAKGLFVDQRWMDLAPGLFSGVHLNREPGYNVAYWNVAQRVVRKMNDGYWVDGQPLCFFHFSGFDANNPDEFSRHQNRYTLADLGDTAALVLDYRSRLLARGYRACQKWPHAFAQFDNGVPIPDLGRPVHHQSPQILEQVADPFSDQGFKAFVDVWNQPMIGPHGECSSISRLAYRIYRMRNDVQEAIPDIFNGTRFHEWLLTTGHSEHHVDAAFLETSSEALRTARREKQDLGRSPGRSTQAGLQARTDLWYRFRDTDGPDRLVFLIWLLTYGCKEQHIQEPQLSVFRAEWKSALAAVENWPKRAWYRLLLAGMSASVAVRSMLPPAWARVPIVDAGWLGRRRTSESRPATDTIHPTSAKGPANGSAGQPPLGLNVVGYLRAETGMGESARSSIAAGRLAGIRVNVKSVQHSGCRNGDSDAGAKSEELSDELTNAVNLFHVNADQTRLVLDSIGDGLLAGRYNIGYWAWELEDFPDRWRSSFDRLHEIWTPSSFCQIAISKKSPIPVIRIPHSLDVRLNRSYPREYFGLPSKGFLYLVIFDVLSVFERKNPLGVIQAFARAFGAESDCHLVVKVNNAGHSPESMERLRAHLADLRATLLDDTFTRDEVNGLINICDCLVSLHRSEGFGLTMAEAMFLSKPVIATGYSGNLDFTRPDNSFLVGYRLCPVGAGCEPYDSHCLWADPNIDEAIQQMRAVFQNPEHRQNVAAKGQAYVHKYLSREAIGGQVRQRLDALRHRRSAQ